MRGAVLWGLLFVVFPQASAQHSEVRYERIRNAGAEPGNWLTYSGNYQGHRYSPLSQITPENAGQLKPAWIYQVRSTHKFETSPIVVSSIMYITEPPSDVTALDTRTGRSLWKYRHPTPNDVRVCCGQVNRGVAILGNRLFVGTIDSRLIALDSRSGHVIWDTVVADYRTGHSITLAPLVVRDKVIIGIAGGEYGIRGFIDAYSARTGERIWRFWTIPSPGQPGSETWEGESWKTGSGATWLTGSFDPELDLLYWGTGNPGPDWNGDDREGDNLYSNCLVALDPDTGALEWYFQFTPHDEHDWDATEIPVLIDGGTPLDRKLVVMANRNGFYYVLDRETGEFLAGREFARQTWAKGLDASGRPMRLPDTAPTVEGTVVYPSMHGATNWNSPSYSPRSHLFYLAAREEGGIFYKGEPEYKPGLRFNGGGFRFIPGAERYGAIRALTPETGEQLWEFRLNSPPWAGVLSTAGGLVFGGTNEGDFFALHAETGKLLWRFQTGGQVIANPVSYLSEGKQQIAVSAGRGLFIFALD